MHLIGMLSQVFDRASGIGVMQELWLVVCLECVVQCAALIFNRASKHVLWSLWYLMFDTLTGVRPAGIYSRA